MRAEVRPRGEGQRRVNMPRPFTRTRRLACLMFAMSIACAASGILLDVRVMTLLNRAGTSAFPQSELERADEVATILLLFTLVVNATGLLIALAWIARAHPAARVAAFIVLASIAIPLANPVAPFLIRGYENGPVFGIAARALGIAAALSAMALVRRTSRPER